MDLVFLMNRSVEAVKKLKLRNCVSSELECHIHMHSAFCKKIIYTISASPTEISIWYDSNPNHKARFLAIKAGTLRQNADIEILPDRFLFPRLIR
jgi:hypothetical protein